MITQDMKWNSPENIAVGSKFHSDQYPCEPGTIRRFALYTKIVPSYSCCFYTLLEAKRVDEVSEYGGKAKWRFCYIIGTGVSEKTLSRYHSPLEDTKKLFDLA
jgi:hypothetical protein